MHAQSFKLHSSQFASAAILVTLLSTFIAPSAFAARSITSNEVSQVRITLHGKNKNTRQLTVTGSLVGTAGDRIYQRVTVTQRSTGAVAEGFVIITATGTNQQWEVRTSAQAPFGFSSEDFEEGPVTVVYFAIADGKENTDAHQWLQTLDLKKE